MATGYYVNAPTTRDKLDRAIAHTAPHFWPMLVAVRDHRVGMLVVQQTPEPFRIPQDPKRPAIVLICDDFDRAVGPEGFHMPSVRRAIRACSSFVIVAAAPTVAAYAAVATTAVLRRQNAMLIETRVEQEIAWLGFIQKLAPGRPTLLSTVEGGRA